MQYLHTGALLKLTRVTALSLDLSLSFSPLSVTQRGLTTAQQHCRSVPLDGRAASVCIHVGRGGLCTRVFSSLSLIGLSRGLGEGAADEERRRESED